MNIVANHNKDRSQPEVKTQNDVPTPQRVETHVRHVKALMAERGLSFPKIGAQIQFGKRQRMGITGWAVSQIIRGDRPNSPLFDQIAAVLGVPVDEIKPPWLRNNSVSSESPSAS